MGVELLSAFLELAGVALLSIAGFLVAPALGYAVAGVGCVLFGLALAPGAPTPRQPPQDN